MVLDPVQITASGTSLIIVAVALIIIIGYLAEALFKVTRVPEIILLMLIGLFLAPVGHVLSPTYVSALRSISSVFASVALVIILFNGAKKITFDSIDRDSARGLLIGLLDVVLPMAALALLMKAAFGWPFSYGALLGAVFGSTTAIVVIPVISSIKIPKSVYNIAFIEVSVNTVFAVLLFSLVLLYLGNTGFTLPYYIQYTADYLSVGIAVGAIAGIIWLAIMSAVKGARGYLTTFAIALLLYGLVDLLNGAGVITVIIFAVIVGNYTTLSKLLHLKLTMDEDESAIAERELEFLVRTFFFVFIGLIASLSESYVIFALAITAALMVVRFIEVKVTLFDNRQYQGLLYSLLPHGLTTAVLASLLYNTGMPYSTQIIYIAFLVILATNVLASILIRRYTMNLELAKPVTA